MLSLKPDPSKQSSARVALFRPRPRPALHVPAGVRTATIAALANVTMSTAQSWRSGRHAPQPRHRAWIELVQRLLAEAGLRS